mgnify:CR=1 FL=1
MLAITELYDNSPIHIATTFSECHYTSKPVIQAPLLLGKVRLRSQQLNLLARDSDCFGRIDE